MQHRSIISFLLFILVYPAYSQVYNYVPINHVDFETNPAILASSIMKNRLQIYHQNEFTSKSSFSYNSARISNYFQSSFFGLGLSLNNTNMDSVKYNHVALGVGYRNVLFNKLLLRLGATYKLIDTNVPSGDFDFYSFTRTSTGTQEQLKDNLNLAASLSSGVDQYYISYQHLNSDISLFAKNNDIRFPVYDVINIGNVMSFFAEPGSEISFTVFRKSSPTNNISVYNEYINLRYKLNLTRESGLNLGAKIGYAENAYYHLVPFLNYNRNNFLVNFAYNFYLDKIDFNSTYTPTFQLSLLYQL